MKKEDVKSRILLGDLPLLDASLSFKSVFSDGREVSHQVMLSIFDEQLVDPPSARGSRWKIRTQETSNIEPVR